MLTKQEFDLRVEMVKNCQNVLLLKKNCINEKWDNGIIDRYVNPVLSAEHIPLDWRYDFNYSTNPYFMERMGINAVLNAGAIEFNGKFILVARVEGVDRKSFFAISESENGIDNFRFWDTPIVMPQTDLPDTNVYDMRLTKHEDGYIYGLFCTERKDPNAQIDDTSSAVAACGISRTKDLITWERLPDLKSNSQQRNVVLHPEFVDGKYALYTRPQDGFIEAGSGGGIGFSLCDSMENAETVNEIIIEEKVYHTIKEVKNGQGATPVKTAVGWLHIAHAVRNTAAGLRYVLYAFMTSLQNPTEVIYSPGGYLIAPVGKERVGDVSNVVFSNGMIEKNGDLYIYYASSDTRMHVATTTIDKMIDYCKNTPSDGIISSQCVQQRIDLIKRNRALLSGI